jgi:hypothetical protein
VANGKVFEHWTFAIGKESPVGPMRIPQALLSGQTSLRIDFLIRDRRWTSTCQTTRAGSESAFARWFSRRSHDISAATVAGAVRRPAGI